MNIKKTQNGNQLTVALEGRLDTVSSPELESELKGSLDGINDLVFDISELEYISSAGLRVLLSTQKVMNKQGEMTITGANEAIMEIFDVTGFVDILNIK
ncbi:MAG: STAS domain-containing protein [Ruminiclostridium sp.]|nr:STAS domain-containing protein [Ruminiclostridium sp.]